MITIVDYGLGDLPSNFVHSDHVVCSDPSDVPATAHHGYDIAGAVGRGNFQGVQFHPETSHRFGLRLLTNFARTSQMETVAPAS